MDVKYKYAFNDKNEIICINDAKRGEKYRCLDCGYEIIVKEGVVKTKHYAHKTTSHNCSFETYLHKLGKLKIKEKFDKSLKFPITIRTEKRCSNYNNCKWPRWNGYCNEITHSKHYDLKNYYNVCSLEQMYNNFKADILLSNSICQISPIFIEICVTHKCETDKINSGIRIMEISLKTEDDLETILNLEAFPECEQIKFYNFNPKPEYGNRCYRRLHKFVLYKSMRGYHKECNCDIEVGRDIEKNIIFEMIFEYNGVVSEYSYYAIGLAAAYSEGFKVANCLLCKYHRSNDLSSTSQIFCCIHKRLNIQACGKYDRAESCRGYMVDLMMLTEVRRQLKEMPHVIWKK